MSAVATFAKSEPRPSGLAVLAVKGAEIFKVVYSNDTQNKVKVNLYNSSSEVIYSVSINNTDGFILPLNFGNLSYGEYKVELIDADGKEVQNISYGRVKTTDNIRIAKLSNENGKFLVAIANPKNEKISVRIFDNHNNLLHDEIRSVSGDFAQVYNVKNLTGTCTFIVSDANGVAKTVHF
jgi:hypothetical protein